MFNQVSWDKPLQWHLNLRSEELSLLERGITIAFFSGLTALCAQIAFVVPWTPVPYTFQTFAVLATGMYLRRNDAFASGCLYLLVGALGAPVFAGGVSVLVIEGTLIASGGYLLAFPFASAIVAEGLDRSAKSETANFNSLLICWTFAMIPVYIVGTLWLAEAYGVGFSQAFEWGVEPFLIWDFAKILVMALVTMKLFPYSSEDWSQYGN